MIEFYGEFDLPSGLLIVQQIVQSLHKLQDKELFFDGLSLQKVLIHEGSLQPRFVYSKVDSPAFFPERACFQQQTYVFFRTTFSQVSVWV